MAEQWITKSKKVNDETVECRNYPFVSLRRDFIAKFFPQLINQSAKKETWKEILNKKYGR